jgi:hypothetical protein
MLVVLRIHASSNSLWGKTFTACCHLAQGAPLETLMGMLCALFVLLINSTVPITIRSKMSMLDVVPQGLLKLGLQQCLLPPPPKCMAGQPLCHILWRYCPEGRAKWSAAQQGMIRCWVAYFHQSRRADNTPSAQAACKPSSCVTITVVCQKAYV